MHFQITADTNKESGVGEVVDELTGPTRQQFISQNYGSGLPRLCVVLMCRDPELTFKRRVRFSKKEQTLYMDIMLHLPEMISLTHAERRRTIVQRLEQEIPEVLTKYAFQDFDQPRFERDVHDWFTSVVS